MTAVDIYFFTFSALIQAFCGVETSWLRWEQRSARLFSLSKSLITDAPSLISRRALDPSISLLKLGTFELSFVDKTFWSRSSKL